MRYKTGVDCASACAKTALPFPPHSVRHMLARTPVDVFHTSGTTSPIVPPFLHQTSRIRASSSLCLWQGLLLQKKYLSSTSGVSSDQTITAKQIQTESRRVKLERKKSFGPPGMPYLTEAKMSLPQSTSALARYVVQFVAVSSTPTGAKAGVKSSVNHVAFEKTRVGNGRAAGISAEEKTSGIPRRERLCYLVKKIRTPNYSLLQAQYKAVAQSFAKRRTSAKLDCVERSMSSRMTKSVAGTKTNNARTEKMTTLGTKTTSGTRAEVKKVSSSSGPPLASRDTTTSTLSAPTTSSRSSSSTRTEKTSMVSPRNAVSRDDGFEIELRASDWFCQQLTQTEIGRGISFEFFVMPKGCLVDILYRPKIRHSGGPTDADHRGNQPLNRREQSTIRGMQNSNPNPTINSSCGTISPRLGLETTSESDSHYSLPWAPLQMKSTTKISGPSEVSKFSKLFHYSQMGLVLINITSKRCWMILGREIRDMHALSVSPNGIYSGAEQKSALAMARTLYKWYYEEGYLEKKPILEWQRTLPGSYTDVTHARLMACIVENVYVKIPQIVQLRYAPPQVACNVFLHWRGETDSEEEFGGEKEGGDDRGRLCTTKALDKNINTAASSEMMESVVEDVSSKKTESEICLNVLHRTAVGEFQRVGPRVTLFKRSMETGKFLPYSESDDIDLFAFLIPAFDEQDCSMEGGDNPPPSATAIKTCSTQQREPLSTLRGLFLFPKSVLRDPYLSAAPKKLPPAPQVVAERPRGFRARSSKNHTCVGGAQLPRAHNDLQNHGTGGRTGQIKIPLYPPHVVARAKTMDPRVKELAREQARWYVDLADPNLAQRVTGILKIAAAEKRKV